jgi:hypothetical protein
MAMTAGTIKQFLKNPGGVLSKKPESTRLRYKAFCDTLLSGRRHKLRLLADTLPKPRKERQVPKSKGYHVLPPGTLISAEAALRRGRQIISDSARVGQAKEGKAHLTHLIQKNDLAAFPELLDFALDPMLLGIAADYLGELPILTSLFLWHSKPIHQAFVNSQLYHRDHDDIRQFKVFLYLSDVDADSGPLTVVPATITTEISQKIGYSISRGKVSDEVMMPHLPAGSAESLTGAAGTIAFVDTSQVFHFGSRVASKDRYVLMLQYLTLTNFQINPFYSFRSYPYSDIARPTDSKLQRTVLGSGIVPTLGSHAGPPVYTH